MNDIKNSGSADSMPITSSSCGVKPSQEALDKGYEVDFTKAKTLLEDEKKPDISPEKKTS